MHEISTKSSFLIKSSSIIKKTLFRLSFSGFRLIIKLMSKTGLNFDIIKQKQLFYRYKKTDRVSVITLID